MSVYTTHRVISAGVVVAYEIAQRIPQDGVTVVSLDGAVEAVPDEHVHDSPEAAMRHARVLVAVERKRLAARWQEVGELRMVNVKDIARDARNGCA